MKIKGWLKNIRVVMVKNGCGHPCLKFVVSEMNPKDEFMNLADFLHVDYDTIIFGLLITLLCTFNFSFYRESTAIVLVFVKFILKSNPVHLILFVKLNKVSQMSSGFVMLLSLHKTKVVCFLKIRIKNSKTVSLVSVFKGCFQIYCVFILYVCVQSIFHQKSIHSFGQYI